MSENLKTSVLDVEHLQQISYVRSRRWAMFLDSINESDSPEVLDINDFEKIYPDLEEDEDELASMEEDGQQEEVFDTDVLRDITNDMNKHNNTSHLTDATVVHDDANEIVGFLNQTLPVISEHNRQLKESGFDRILDTFDAKKIEEKVGSWLRRHNSLCMPNSPNMPVADRHCDVVATKVVEEKFTKPFKYYRRDDTDSVDSFHSGETARYIRSSRAGAIKNSSSPTMMIKTYRKVKSSRQALRAKYACAHDEDAEKHLNKLRHKRRLANEIQNHRMLERYSGKSYNSMPRSATPSYTSCLKKKRRVLRKRSASNSCSTKDTSSDSDSSFYERETTDKFYQRKYKLYKHHQHKTLKGRYALDMPASVLRSQRRHVMTATAEASFVKRFQYRHKKVDAYGRSKDRYYYEANMSDSTSPITSSSSSLSSPPPASKLRKKKLPKSGDRRRCNDHRPFKYESKCGCFKEKKLCQKYRHLSDLSTDEWVVETSLTRNRRIVPHSDQRLCNPTTQNRLSITGITTLKDDSPIVSSSIPSSKLTTVTAAPTPMPTPISTPIPTPMPTPMPAPTPATKSFNTPYEPCENNEEQLEFSDDESFERELQLALKESKKLYERTKKKAQKLEQKKLINQQLPTSTKRTTDSSSMKAKPIDKPLLKRQRAMEAYLTGNKEPKADKLSLLPKDEAFPLRVAQSTMSFITNKNETMPVSEDTFFANTNRVCNSTALQNNNTVCKRQIDEGTDEIKNHRLDTKHSLSSKSAIIVEEDVEEESESDKALAKQNYKSTSNEYKSPVKTLTKRLPRKAYADNSSTDDKCVNKKDTPRPKRNATKLNNTLTQPANDDFIFAIPQARATSNKSNTKLRATGQTSDVTITDSKSNAMEKQTNEIDSDSVSDIDKILFGQESPFDRSSSERKQLRNSQFEKAFKMDKKVKNNKNNSNVSSTTFHSPEMTNYLQNIKNKKYNRRLQISSSSEEEDDNDCTIVSSTTNNAAAVADDDGPSTSKRSTTLLSHSASYDKKTKVVLPSRNYSQKHQTNKGIIIYTPKNAARTPASHKDGCYFHITKEHLSSVIGEKPAERFLKYYIGRRRFNTNSTVYYKPPEAQVLDTIATTSSDSDEDDLERLGKYGHLYESVGGGDADGLGGDAGGDAGGGEGDDGTDKMDGE